MLVSEKHPLILLSTEFAELCKPLAPFHIQHFTYQKQYNDGARISLSNKPDWIKDYYNLALYASSLFEEKPSDYKAGFSIWTGEYDIEVYIHGRKYYNTDHSISITEPTSDGCEHYLFSTAVDKPAAIKYLANNMDILFHFILYLKEHAVNILKKAQESKIYIQKSFDTKPAQNSDQQNFFHEMQTAKKAFYMNTPIHRYVFESKEYLGVKLTHREISCIAHLLQGSSADETAKLMNLSRRTVESYLDNIKIKLNCATKSELFHKLKSNKYLTSFLYRS